MATMNERTEYFTVVKRGAALAAAAHRAYTAACEADGELEDVNEQTKLWEEAYVVAHAAWEHFLTHSDYTPMHAMSALAENAAEEAIRTR